MQWRGKRTRCQFDCQPYPRWFRSRKRAWMERDLHLHCLWRYPTAPSQDHGQRRYGRWFRWWSNVSIQDIRTLEFTSCTELQCSILEKTELQCSLRNLCSFCTKFSSQDHASEISVAGFVAWRLTSLCIYLYFWTFSIPLEALFQEGSLPPTVHPVVKEEKYCGEIKIALTFTPAVCSLQCPCGCKSQPVLCHHAMLIWWAFFSRKHAAPTTRRVLTAAGIDLPDVCTEQEHNLLKNYYCYGTVFCFVMNWIFACNSHHGDNYSELLVCAPHGASPAEFSLFKTKL